MDTSVSLLRATGPIPSDLFELEEGSRLMGEGERELKELKARPIKWYIGGCSMRDRSFGRNRIISDIFDGRRLKEERRSFDFVKCFSLE